MKRIITDDYVSTMLCLLAALYIVIAVEWLRRGPAPIASIVRIPEPFAGDPFVQSHLRDRIPVVRIENLPLAAALEQLKSETHARIAVRWDQLKEVDVVPQTLVNAILSDVDLGTALRVILRSANSELDYGVRNGGIVVTRWPDDTPRSMMGYDVRDIIPPPPPPPAPPVVSALPSGSGIGAGGGGGGLFGGGPEHRSPEVELCDTINACLHLKGRDERTEASQATVDVWANRLIVVGTPEAHRQIESILRQLRRTDTKYTAEHRSKP